MSETSLLSHCLLNNSFLSPARTAHLLIDLGRNCNYVHALLAIATPCHEPMLGILLLSLLQVVILTLVKRPKNIRVM